jgi:ubiquinone/menaquinone biosynthesis C-methylase UbiE
VRCSVERLPFRDGAFDFIVCRHVLEHVRDPAAACLELMRVGRHGYIECPRSWVEYAFSSEDHRWLVDHEAQVLIFREKLPEERRDFLGIQYAIFDWIRQPAFLLRWNEPGIRRVRTVMVSWSGRFAFAVMMAGERLGRGRSRTGAARRR